MADGASSGRAEPGRLQQRPHQTAVWLRASGVVLLIVGSVVFAWDVVAKLRKREAAVPAATQREQPVASRVLGGDEEHLRENDD